MELDVRISADGRLAIIHDPTLDRTTLGTGRVGSLTWAQIRSAPLRGAAGDDGRVPELSEAIACLPGDTSWLIELKPEAERGRELVAAVIDALAQLAAGDRSRLISFDRALLHQARDLAPHIARGVLEARDVNAALLDAAEMGCCAVLLQHELVTSEVVAQSRDSGLILTAWTANSPEVVRRLIDLGVDEIASDYPDMALRLVGGW